MRDSFLHIPTNSVAYVTHQPLPPLLIPKDNMINNPKTTEVQPPSKMASKETISLTSPRPVLQRNENVYVTAPSSSSSSNFQTVTSVCPNRLDRLLTSKPLVDLSVIKTPSPLPDSIICRQCGQCKCHACRIPHKVPECWLCNKSCLCSTHSVVDVVSCMCCVRGLFYHCGSEDENSSKGCRNTIADRPCDCSMFSLSCGLRWSCLSLASFLLPCLLCYLPLKGCVKMCDSAYAKAHDYSCHCVAHPSSPNSDSRKILLM